MKKLLPIFLLTSQLLFGQDKESPAGRDAYHRRDHTISAGIGAPNLYKWVMKSGMETVNSLATAIAGRNHQFFYSSSGLGPLFLKYEFATGEHGGIGLNLAYMEAMVQQVHSFQITTQNPQSGLEEWTEERDVIRLRVNSLSIGLRLNYHIGNGNRWDPYVGLAAGYSRTRARLDYAVRSGFFNFDDTNYFKSPLPFYLATTFGLRYYVLEPLALYAELGIDKWAIIQGGVTLRIR